MSALSGKEVATHNSRESCWIIVHGARLSSVLLVVRLSWFLGKVYDVTDFLDGMPSEARPRLE